MQSSGNISCSDFESDKSSGVIKGTYTCVGASKNVQTGTSTSTGTSSSASATATASGAANANLQVPAAMGFMAFLGAMLL